MMIIGMIFYVFAMPLASLFTSTKEVQLLVADVLRIIAFFQPFSALVQVITNALQGAGDTRFPMYSTFLGIWGIRLGIGYIPVSYTHLDVYKRQGKNVRRQSRVKDSS